MKNNTGRHFSPVKTVVEIYSSQMALIFEKGVFGLRSANKNLLDVGLLYNSQVDYLLGIYA